MNIGLFFKHEKYGGGIYQYFLTIMNCIKTYGGKDRYFLFYRYEPESIPELEGAGITPISLAAEDEATSATGSGGDRPPRYSAIHDGRKIYFRTKPFSEELKKACEHHQIDLMIFSNAERESFESGIPYVTAVLDWTHRTHPQFREFSADGVYEQREYILTNGIENSRLVLVDSETAKKEITEYYDVQSEKIAALPFVPPPYLDNGLSRDTLAAVQRKYKLPERFIFYPAQFWPHKNHEGIIRALHLIKQNTAAQIPAVFVGSAQSLWSNLEQVMDLADQLGVKRQIMHLGYVENEEMHPLYSLATALVMPTFPGPTNIPVLEAFAAGCPVITTDIPALGEQVGDAGLLVDPESPEQIAAAMLRVWTEDQLRRDLAQRGHARLANWRPADFCRRLYKIIEKAKSL